MGRTLFAQGEHLMRRIPTDPDHLDRHRTGEILTLSESQAHYAITVLRLGPGDPVELFDGRGVLARTTLVEIDPPRVRIETITRTERGESPLSTVLFQAIPKGKRWDTILEKSTELGVEAIVPLQTERTVVKVSAPRAGGKQERWEKITAAAARQCGRSRIPEISAPRSLKEALEAYPDLMHLVAHTGGAGRRSLSEAFASRADHSEGSIGVWIGPEGGFTSQEVQLLEAAGAIPFHLGSRILRADTAGLTALSILQALGGDLQ